MSLGIKLAPLKWALASTSNTYTKAAARLTVGVHPTYPRPKNTRSGHSSNAFRVSYRYYKGEDNGMEEGEDVVIRFEEAVGLFNEREYYKCHDLLEALWMRAEDPARTLFHAFLQCAVGLHHLFNQNHRGAMMELGEGLCKLRKMNFQAGGPFAQFQGEIAALLDFIYQTQLELAACTDDLCLQMDQSERSYQLLGGFAAGQQLYFLQDDCQGDTHVVFCPERSYASAKLQRVKLPTLHASDEHLLAFQY